MCFEHLRRFICLAIIALAPLLLHAQEPRYRIETISTRDGLSPTKANAIIQDRYGLIWIASPDGLYRYDGYSFRSYRHNPFDTTSLSHPSVLSVAEDSSGNIWAGTERGLNRLDRRTGRFTRFRHNPHNTFSLSSDYRIIGLAADRNGLWVTSWDSFDRYDIRTGRFRRVGRGAWGGLPAGTKMSTYIDRAGHIWITTVANSDGMIQSAVRADTSTVFLSRFDPSQGSFTTWSISSRGGSMGVAGERDGMPILTYDRIDTGSKAMIYLFDPASGRLAPFDIPSRQSNRNKSQIFYVANIDEDWCWYMTRGISNVPTLFREQLVPFESMRSGVHSRTARDVVARQPIMTNQSAYGGGFRDRSGAYWSTTDKGIVRVIPVAPGIRTWPASMDGEEERDNPNVLSWRIVSSVLVDRYGVLWVGTGMGLNRYEPATGRWHKYYHNPRQYGSLPHNFVVVIHEDPDGTLFFGTYAGIVAYDRQNDRFYNPYPLLRWPRPDDARITSLLRDSRKRLWIGTFSAGIIRLDSTGGVEQWFKSDATDPQAIPPGPVRNILEDRRGEIWTGTSQVLCRWIPKSERFLHYREGAFYLYEDLVGCLWLCRSDSISQYNRERDTFTTITPPDLAGTNLYSMREDDAGNFWLGTDYGLVRWNRRNNSIRRYDENDGLQGDEFGILNALFKASDGTFYWGSDNGLNAFTPTAFRDNRVPPSLAITGFALFDSLASHQMFDGDTIRLDHTQNFFSFEFAALDLVNSGRNRYAYILEGLDPQWINTDSRHRLASYTDLAPGTYTFRMRGSNNDGIWNERGITITIIIAPPWWQTWWFRIAAALAATVIVVTALRLRTNSIRRHEREKREHAVQAALEMQESERQRIARDLHDGVGQMLAAARINLSQLGKMIDRYSPAGNGEVKMRNPLDRAMGIIGRAGDDVRVLSHALGTSTVRELGLVAALRELLSGVEAQEKTSFEFVTVGMDKRLSDSVEIGLFRVAQELIANVLHHANASEATVQIMREQDVIHLSVEDNGRGFDLVATNGGGMGRHNIAARIAAMGGEVHYDSTPGHGTTVTVVVKEERRDL
jgi:signal transduction histidine kinase/ligand-binding sensor domain-containing protein